jgi:hypothetical protein
MARVHTEMAIRVLASIASQPSAPESARVTAASQLLDRGWGKAPATLAGPDGGSINVIIRQIIDIAKESDGSGALVIEHDDAA